jgi:hypothetical protein
MLCANPWNSIGCRALLDVSRNFKVELETEMTDDIHTGRSSTGNGRMTVVLGAVLVAIVALAFFVFGGESSMSGSDKIDAQAPQTEQPAAIDSTGSTGSTGQSAPTANQ